MLSGEGRAAGIGITRTVVLRNPASSWLAACCHLGNSVVNALSPNVTTHRQVCAYARVCIRVNVCAAAMTYTFSSALQAPKEVACKTIMSLEF